MIKLVITPDGQQTITEICDCCGCHVNDLEVEDILVKGDTDAKVFDKNGNEVTRKQHDRQHCEGTHCEMNHHD